MKHQLPRALALATLMVLVPSSIWAVDGASKSEGEPSPEPYSFSYNAESLGGYSSHQESGDGSGRVKGFYIIMGDDNRERRVDYVADENGYRASISTNEVGTRSESSADAQYNARVPSEGQLQQAKVTAEEYKFLEDQHLFERERRVNQIKSTNKSQQQSDNNPQWSRAEEATPGNYQQAQTLGSVANKSTQKSQRWNSNQSINQQIELTATSTEASSSTSIDQENADEGWRRGRLLANSDQQRQQHSGTWTSPGWNQTKLAKTSQQQREQQREQRKFVQNDREPEFSQLVTSGPLNLPNGETPNTIVPQRQQARQAALQPVELGASPARASANQGNILQSQIEQQFMLQANQLTNEDYPRQQNLQGAAAIELQQRPLIDQRQLQQQSSNRRTNSVDTQAPEWQTFTAFNQQQQSQEQGQDYSQQQRYIIDEVIGGGGGDGRVDVAGQTATSKEEESVNNFTAYSTANPIQFRPTPQYVDVKQQQQLHPHEKQQQFNQPIKTLPVTTTTTSQPAPSGFIAITLGQDSANETQRNTPQQPDREVETKQPNLITTQSLQVAGGENTIRHSARQPQQVVQVQNIDDQQGSIWPNSIKQTIGRVVEQQQQKEQVTAKQQPNISTPTQIYQEEVATTQEPEMIDTTTERRVEVSRIPVQKIETTTSSQVPTNKQEQQQFVTTTLAPKITNETPTLLLSTPSGKTTGKPFFVPPQISRQPQFFRQPQKQNFGTKSGYSDSQSAVNTYQPTTYQTINGREQQDNASESPPIPTSTSGLLAIVTQGSSSQNAGAAYQQTASVDVDKRPKLVPQLQPQQKVQTTSYKRPVGTPEFRGQQRRRQQTIETTTSSTPRPFRISTETKQEAWKGTKSGQKASYRRQFWQQQPAVATAPVTPNQSVAKTTNFRASVDYANSTVGFGSRILGG